MSAAFHPVKQRPPLPAGQAVAIDIDQHHHIERTQRGAILGNIMRRPERLLRLEAADMNAGQIGRRRICSGHDGVQLILWSQIDQARFPRCPHDALIIEQFDPNLIRERTRLDIQQRRFRGAGRQINRTAEGIANHRARCLRADHQPARHRLAIVLQIDANRRPFLRAEKRIKARLDRHFDDIAEIVLRRHEGPLRQQQGRGNHDEARQPPSHNNSRIKSNIRR